MRQLISVVTETSIAYFLGDDGEAEQIAMVINSGLDVPGVLKLGTNLLNALQLNGEAVKALPAPVEAQRRRIESGSGSAPTGSQRWTQRVYCPVPGCDYTSKRSNLPGHLMTQRHGWDKERANAAARDARPVDRDELMPQHRPKPPKPYTKPKSAPRGVAGQRHIAGTVAPMFEAFAASQPYITSRMCADHFHMDPSRCRKVINKLVDDRKLIDITPADARGSDAKRYATPEQIAAARA